MDQLVPGDIVNIEAGDLVPADARILTAATLEIDESALTGESVPTPKQVDAVAADAALGDRVDMAFMNCQVTRGAGTILVTTTGMATEVGHISGMLQATGDREDPADQAAGRADEPDPGHRRRRARDLHRSSACTASVQLQELFLSAVAFAVAAIPTALPAVVTAILSKGSQTLADGRRDHEASALGGDARLDLRAQLRQDRHADAQPDDRRPDGDRRAALLDHRRRLLDDRADHPRGRPARRPARAVPAADGPVRRRRGPRWRARGRPDRGRARRARRQGRCRSDAHPRAVPARGDAAVRRGLQDDGHVPQDDGRERQGRHPRLHQGRAGPAPRPRGQRPRPGRHRGPGRPDPRRVPAPRTSAWAPRVCASWRPVRRTSTRPRSTRTPTCCRCSTA